MPFSTFNLNLTLIFSLDKLYSTCLLQKYSFCFLDSVVLLVLQTDLQSSSRYSNWMFINVLKTYNSLFLLICSSQRSLTLLALFVSFLQISCLHVSFTVYENFYKLSKNALSFHLLSTFSPSEVSEIRNSTIE